MTFYDILLSPDTRKEHKFLYQSHILAIVEGTRAVLISGLYAGDRSIMKMPIRLRQPNVQTITQEKVHRIPILSIGDT